jgi:hypothetical protein
MLAACAHYYAVLIVVPLATGEVVRTIRTKRIDWWIWTAMTAPLPVLLWFLPVIEGARSLSGWFWARPSPSQLLNFAAELLGFAVVPCAMALLTVVLWLHIRPERPDVLDHQPAVPLEEIAAATALAMLPVLLWFLAKTVTNGYHVRYALWSIAGFGALLGFGLHRVFRGRTDVVLLLSGALAAWFCVRSGSAIAANHAAQRALAGVAALLEKNVSPDLPIVMGDVQAFHDLSFYASPELRSRIVYAASAEMSRKYVGHDTIDRQLPLLARWVPFNVIAYESFIRKHSEFYLYGNIPGWTWVTQAVVDSGLPATVEGVQGGRYLLHVRQEVSTVTGPTTTDPGDKNDPQKPDTSLCTAWLGDTLCDKVLR